MNFENRAALVTGGGRGIGRAIALALAAQGAAVAVNYRAGKDEALALVGEIEESGGRAVALQADVSDPAQATALVAEATEALGGLHVLINNAGITRNGLLWDMPADGWDHVMRVNFGGAYHCTRAVAEQFMRQGEGAIVNLSSVMGERGWPGQSNYAASKGALNAFTRSTAIELARFGVRVNAVIAGIVPTGLVDDVLAQHGGAGMRKQIPLRRFATAEQVAAGVLFLAGPDASYVTGELMHIDGGLTAQLGMGHP
ncbi:MULTISPECIES: SDR family NAD(P)-dependent oxidoreductase [unclassified Streptomyces]|uniref:SDR family NAD(P)-dependent oxidoreductase n=1 Tax=unclassified Streptomyces TaxID=2593676 RepID=UPI003331DECF